MAVVGAFTTTLIPALPVIPDAKAKSATSLLMFVTVNPAAAAVNVLLKVAPPEIRSTTIAPESVPVFVTVIDCEYSEPNGKMAISSDEPFNWSVVTTPKSKASVPNAAFAAV